MARRLSATVLLAGALAACGDDAVEVAGELTEEEAVSLLEAVGALMTDTTVVPLHASEDSVVLPCPQGGRVKLAGTIVDEQMGDTLRTQSDLAYAFTTCGVTGDGNAYTLGDDSFMKLEMELEIIGFFEEVNLEGSLTGDFEWKLEERSGPCLLNMTVDGDGETVITKGSLCGHTVELKDLILA